MLHVGTSVIAAAVAFHLGKRRQRLPSKPLSCTSLMQSASVDEVLKLAESGSVKPPLPSIIKNILLYARLTFLATSIDDNPHLSLMNFTYVKEEEVIVMSTAKHTKKFDFIQKQPNVSLLFHDFAAEGDSGQRACTYSITLNGAAKIVTCPIEREKYRALHLQKNAEYPQFIVGDHIEIVVVYVQSARVCNVHDHDNLLAFIRVFVELEGSNLLLIEYYLPIVRRHVVMASIDRSCRPQYEILRFIVPRTKSLSTFGQVQT
ncbi:hypothetical protein CYMTET_20549 [Cymbomonas tetramitiformis]|uniref:Pyridoxamine 5'-phosphate oxidase N-terminal domain-containing protein n=1 Tax=Cymbomonas tetramitiformis TaxID=36881 RepID=A0AAE0L3S7_9CHLO|nr:hypothetical protein CYMTET_20549 [Cymbomonas tetramitiformis]